MKRNIIAFILCLIILTALLTGTGYFSRRYSFAHDNYISFFIFTLAMYLHIRLAKKTPPEKLLRIYCILFVILNIIPRILEGWHSGLASLPNVLFMGLGICSGYILAATGRPGRFVFPVIVLLLAVAQAFVFHPYWLHFVNYNNFTGKVKESAPPAWKSYTIQGDTVTTATYKDKYLLLDFWNTGCAVCFVKFPKLQLLYDKYKHNSEIAILSVNIPWPRDTAGMAFERISNKGYSFPVVVSASRMDSLFDVQAYPTVIILKNEAIIFRGNIEEAEQVLKKL